MPRFATLCFTADAAIRRATLMLAGGAVDSLMLHIAAA